MRVIALGLALAVVVVEWVWVTDNERIEQVVYDLRRAVSNSDAEGVLAHLAPNVQYLQGETALSEDATRALIRVNLSSVHFDFVRISDLQTSAMRQARRGTAEFRVFARGSLNTSAGTFDTGTTNHGLVVGFPGDRTGRLEGEPDQPGLDPTGDPWPSLAGCRTRMSPISASTTASASPAPWQTVPQPTPRSACGNRRSAGASTDQLERN